MQRIFSSPYVRFAAVVFGLALPAVAFAGPSDPLHAPGVTVAAPPASPPSAAPAGSSASSSAAPGAVVDVRRGVVTIERDGRVLGLGTVLSGDGRILTALSALGPTDLADVRYTDGHVVHARAVHQDKVWDLALLVPLSGKWLDGLRASDQDPAGGELKGFVSAGPGKAQLVAAHFKGKVDAQARDGSALPGALDVDLHGASAANGGAPLVDVAGNVIGVVVRACRADSAKDAVTKPGKEPPCTVAHVAAPVSAIRAFLVRTPLNAVAPSPWLGIVGAPDTSGTTHGVRVMAVAPGSPAEKGGLRTNPDRTAAHLIVAVDGRPVDTPEKLAEIIGKHAIGDSVKVLILDGDKLRELVVVLRAAP